MLNQFQASVYKTPDRVELPLNSLPTGEQVPDQILPPGVTAQAAQSPSKIALR